MMGVMQVTDSRQDMYMEFYEEVCKRTAQLVAGWQCVGFCHGDPSAHLLTHDSQCSHSLPYLSGACHKLYIMAVCCLQNCIAQLCMCRRPEHRQHEHPRSDD